ncbi:hypothetical protein BE15_15245 [Sorangium cellulosum]|uniref:PIN domain-containing protein n=1 Tax=Sorangium cellulosum TaxID=56 RepID=A0A150QQW2_SORCE|nr:hypothetical protein BE15_15245 [Sorangium cellulosum]
MKLAFDTSVLVAGLHRAHPHHGRAVVWIDAVAEGQDHRFVLVGRSRIAAGVVMGQDEAVGGHVQRRAQDDGAADVEDVVGTAREQAPSRTIGARAR